MIIHRVIKKILDRHSKTYLLPIRQTESYYYFLESRFFEQMNPFRRLLIRTKTDMKKASSFVFLSNSDKIR